MIEGKNIVFSYTGLPPYVLNEIDLDVQRGAYISVVGDNGSGKSTLMQLILGFIKPTSGKIIVQAKRTGYVPQKKDFSNSNFPITVYEALNSYRKLLRIKDKRIIGESLDIVGMKSFSNALMGTLSGGQSQKILIARALMGNPDLLILDEPSTGVDASSQIEIYGFLKALNQQKGMTIISVEHNLDAAISNSTLIYHLTAGKGHLCTPNQYINEFLPGKRREDHNV